MTEREGPGEFSFVDAVRRHSRAVAIITLAVFLPVMLLQLTATPKFAASATVAPAGVTAASSPSMAGLSRLASLGGVSLPQDDAVSQFERFRYILRSDRLAERLEKRHKLVRTVFAYRWDEAKGRWREPGILGRTKARFYAMSGIEISPVPDARDLAGFLRQELEQKEIGDTGLLVIGYADSDPERAARVVELAVSEADSLLRADATRKATSQILYLNQRLQITTVDDYRAFLIDLLAGEERKLMLAASGAPFAVEIVQPVTVTKEPVEPRPVIMGIIALIFGFGLGVFFAIVRYAAALSKAEQMASAAVAVVPAAAE